MQTKMLQMFLYILLIGRQDNKFLNYQNVLENFRILVERFFGRLPMHRDRNNTCSRSVNKST